MNSSFFGPLYLYRQIKITFIMLLPLYKSIFCTTYTIKPTLRRRKTTSLYIGFQAIGVLNEVL